jgi:RNase P/RNase MRP subunit p29
MKPHQQNLIGKHATITDAHNQELIGKSGTVEDETKNTITLNGKKIPKEHLTLTINGQTTTMITKTPTERIKVHKQ